MGLGMYLFRKPKNFKLKMFNKLRNEEDEEIGYWRKAYPLHEKFLSYADGKNINLNTGNGGDLNCVPIPLTKEELKEILEWAKEILKEEAFEDDYEEEGFKDAKLILTKALKTDFENYEIYYYAWW